MTDGREVQIVHLFDAPRERVFQAWMDPDEVSRWWAPEGFEVASGSVQIEAEVGGRFHLTMVDARDSTPYGMKAKILEIDVPKLIVLRTDPIPEVGIDQPTITRVHRMRRAVAIAVTASAKATRASWGRLCPP